MNKPTHEHLDRDGFVAGSGPNDYVCSWCEEPMCRDCRHDRRLGLCKECSDDGVVRCSICRRLWVPHNEAEEALADEGNCPHCPVDTEDEAPRGRKEWR